MPISSSTQIEDILRNKLTKRNVDVRFLDMGDVQKIGGDKVKQVIKVRNGIETEDAKKIQRLIKDSKIKVQAAIQGESVRVTGAKRDDLQAAMALMRKDITDMPDQLRQFPRLRMGPPRLPLRWSLLSLACALASSACGPIRRAARHAGHPGAADGRWRRAQRRCGGRDVSGRQGGVDQQRFSGG